MTTPTDSYNELTMEI